MRPPRQRMISLFIAFLSAFRLYSCLGFVMLWFFGHWENFPFMALEGWEQGGEQVMKNYPWDYILWILDYIWHCGIGGGHGGEEDYISYIVLWSPVLEDFVGLGLRTLFICFIEYEISPIYGFFSSLHILFSLLKVLFFFFFLYYKKRAVSIYMWIRKLYYALAVGLCCNEDHLWHPYNWM